MTDKERYRELCAIEPSIPIYSRDWWLDCVCGENQWNVCLCLSDRCPDVIEAAFPFYIPYKKTIMMPPFTQTMGVWFNPKFEDENYSKNLLRKQKICEQLIQHLPKHTYFIQNFHYLFTDWLPFYWSGYTQTTRYTYIIPDIGDEDRVWNNFSKEMKRKIENARTKHKLTVKRGVSPEDFLHINKQIFKKQGINNIDYDTLKKLIERSRVEDRGDVWGAFDEEGQLHAAQFIVWQKDFAYCIAGGSSLDFRKSGAHSLLIWEVIRFASTVSNAFNFAGSMIKGVEYFNRGFGAIQKPYFTISKGNRSLIRKLIEGLCKYFSIRSK
jgi:hypothetical protein